MKDTTSGKHLWTLTAAYILFIYATLPFMRSLIEAASSTLGRDVFRLMMNMLVIAVLILLIFFAYSKSLVRMAFVAILVAAAAWFVFSIRQTEERIHFIEYAVLGILVIRATGKSGSFPIALAIVIAAGSLDEAIQWVLPNRVGDIRDIMMNISGGIIGLWCGRPSR